MSKVIALCFSTPGMDRVEWTQAWYGKKYPGAGWMKWLSVLASSDQPKVIDGKNALNFDPKNIIVVQEENNEYGQELVKRGADPRVQMCLESPIFASKFYDSIREEDVQRTYLQPFFPIYVSKSYKGFKHRLFFNGGTEHLYFPSFDDEDIKEPMPWNERKFMCMVTSNKHYCMLDEYKNDYWAETLNKSSGLSEGIFSWGGRSGQSFRKAMETQLHDYRYNAIKHFLPKEDFDLYGKGWNVHGIGDRECTDKLETIRKYKFALCFENGAYPGYITEKIIDCFVAGVIPVYMGATNIDKYIPRDLYMDARDYFSFNNMECILKAFSDIYCDAGGMTLAQRWLKSPEGRMYDNKVFANHILELCQ